MLLWRARCIYSCFSPMEVLNTLASSALHSQRPTAPKTEPFGYLFVWVSYIEISNEYLNICTLDVFIVVLLCFDFIVERWLEANPTPVCLRKAAGEQTPPRACSCRCQKNIEQQLTKNNLLNISNLAAPSNTVRLVSDDKMSLEIRSSILGYQNAGSYKQIQLCCLNLRTRS